MQFSDSKTEARSPVSEEEEEAAEAQVSDLEKAKAQVPEPEEETVHDSDSEEGTMILIECNPMALPGQREAIEEWQGPRREEAR